MPGMADVPLWVAVITAGAGIIGAAIPQAVVVLRDVRQAERDRRERTAATTHEACVALLRAAGELRTLAESIPSYRGDPNGLQARVTEVRARAEETRLHAAAVSMWVPDRLAEPADLVASAASGVTDDVLRCTDLNEWVPVGEPDVSKLVAQMAVFRREAVQYARGGDARQELTSAESSRAYARRAAARAPGNGAAAPDRLRRPRALLALRRHTRRH